MARSTAECGATLSIRWRPMATVPQRSNIGSPVPLTLSLSKLRGAMHDWAPAIIATALFALLCPGGILQLPGRQRTVDFMNLRTSCLSILVHAVIYGVLLMLFVVILQAHLYV
ncbi:hypothetical protein VPH35_061582 [Triticum aestivum]|uniref:Uncharacterized protein n=1 Tax=Aegilops tauschii TaxID=37682 RepID=N1R0X9_AEGTA